MIKDYYIQKVKEKEKLSEGLRISLAGLCPLRHYRAVKFGEEFSDETLLIFARGLLLEDAVREFYAKNFPRRVRYQVEIQHPFGIGHADIVFPAEREIIEVKSCDDKAKLPQEHHITQLNLYLHYMMINRKEEGWRGRLVYVKTPSFSFEEFVINYDKERALRDEEILRLIWDALLREDEKSLYPLAHWKSWECGYETRRKNVYRCPHLQYCKSIFQEKESEKPSAKLAVDKENLVLQYLAIEEELKDLREKERELEEEREELRKLIFADGVNKVETADVIMELVKVEQERLDTKRFKLEHPELAREYLKTIEFLKVKIHKKEVQDEEIEETK